MDIGILINVIVIKDAILFIYLVIYNKFLNDDTFFTQFEVLAYKLKREIWN